MCCPTSQYKLWSYMLVVCVVLVVVSNGIFYVAAKSYADNKSADQGELKMGSDLMISLATTIIASLLCVVATLTSKDCLGLVRYV